MFCLLFKVMWVTPNYFCFIYRFSNKITNHKTYYYKICCWDFVSKFSCFACSAHPPHPPRFIWSPELIACLRYDLVVQFPSTLKKSTKISSLQPSVEEGDWKKVEEYNITDDNTPIVIHVCIVRQTNSGVYQKLMPC